MRDVLDDLERHKTIRQELMRPSNLPSRGRGTREGRQRGFIMAAQGAWATRPGFLGDTGGEPLFTKAPANLVNAPRLMPVSWAILGSLVPACASSNTFARLRCWAVCRPVFTIV